MKVKLATDNETISSGNIYIAPEHHLIIKEEVIRVVNGPDENRWRPSIDVTFRSAAVAYRERVIGIILTGLLNDGTAGMLAIKKCGGKLIVQDPNEAEFPDMPFSILENMEVDYRVTLTHMGHIIHQLINNLEPTETIVPEEIMKEAKIAEKTITNIEEISRLGTPGILSCPDCGGGLWEIKEGNFHRYRCHIGHTYSESDLLLKQAQQIDTTLWVAIRIMEERYALLLKLSKQDKQKGMKIIWTN